jgi:hypothetical protein
VVEANRRSPTRTASCYIVGMETLKAIAVGVMMALITCLLGALVIAVLVDGFFAPVSP